MPEPTASARRTQQRGEATRRDLLDAALREFSAVGFEAASTRTIAASAGVRQGQLTYHFETKDVLWRATVDHLFERFDAEFGSTATNAGPVTDPGTGPSTNGPADAAAALEVGIRSLVRAVSRLPELNRIMVHEATAASDRLAWLVDRHVRPRYAQFADTWRQAQAGGATRLGADPLLVYYCLVGAASLLYVNAPEAALLAGAGTTGGAAGAAGAAGAERMAPPALAEAHADALVTMLLASPPPRRRSTRRARPVSRED